MTPTELDEQNFIDIVNGKTGNPVVEDDIIDRAKRGEIVVRKLDGTKVKPSFGNGKWTYSPVK